MKLIRYFAGFFLFSIMMVSCSNFDESSIDFTDNNDQLLYSESFADSMGHFVLVSENAKVSWTYSRLYSCMLVSGYISSVRYADTAMLVSPEIDLTKVTSAYCSFDGAGRYFSSPSNEATVWVAENYVTGTRVDSVSWSQVKIPEYFTNSDFTFVNTGQVDLKAFAGKKVRIALKYISSATVAGTWEVKNFKVYSGVATTKIKNLGAGTEESPYTVSGAISNQTSASAWVSGYIVGYAWSGNPSSFYFAADTCTQTTNLLIADTTSGFYLSRCVAVQLPSGVVRNGLNLVANDTLLGRKVTLYGSMTSYFGMDGLKSLSYYKIEKGASGGTKPIKAIFSETFANNSQGQFTIQNIAMPSALTYVWVTSASYGMMASGFKSSTDYETESWLISPSISLSGVSTAKMTFDHALNYVATPANKTSYVTVWASTDYQSGLPSTATWTQVTIPTYPAGTNWTFVSSGDLNLTPFVGSSNVRVAFRYKSISGDAATWEVKNVVVY